MKKTGGAIVALLIGCLLSIASVESSADEGKKEVPKDWEQRLENLRAIPYLGLSETTVESGDTGVILSHPSLVFDGYNLYCSRQSRKVSIIDMNGLVVHQWDCLSCNGKNPYEHGLLLNNGDIMLIKEGISLCRLDWDSRLIWEKPYQVHHEVVPLPDGSFYSIDRHLRNHRGFNIFFDRILHLAADGLELSRWSTYDHLAELREVLDDRNFLDVILDSIETGRSPKGSLAQDVRLAMKRRATKKLDYFHLNAISIIPTTPLGKKDARFKQGNLLVCFRNVNQMAVLEKDTFRVLWAWGEGELQWPHQPTLLDNGHILIFDNGVDRRYSRVLEFDPLSEMIVWQYQAEKPQDFFTSGGGSAQRLPNGNTLICETNSGRVFEVTWEGDVVWLWLNPATHGNRRQTVYRMTRLPKEMLEPLLRSDDQ